MSIVKKSNIPVRAIFDTRLNTVWVFQKIFGNKVKYDAFRKIGFTLPCTKKDIKHFSLDKPSNSFKDSIKYFSKTKLSLKFDNYLEI